MNRIGVFISSVQVEFAAERQMVFDYLCREANLNPPEFIQEEIFRTIIWRPVTDQATDQATDHATDHATGQVSGQVPEEVRRLMLILKGEINKN
ncbi:MAG TPA: hypothetical protein PLR50_04255 [Candidatus Rifleibacterium sp.]|nr:hypothetical protein [Candidatus Rifleibacterium sp.]